MGKMILVDKQDCQIGIMEKLEAHQKALLHRAFSIFIFNSKNQILLQQHVDDKYHSGGLWTNTCCSHPRPGEDTLAAANRRLKEEMGFETSLHKIFDFTYKAAFANGFTEHEYDHVFTGYYDGIVCPAINEVKIIAGNQFQRLKNGSCKPHRNLQNGSGSPFQPFGAGVMIT